MSAAEIILAILTGVAGAVLVIWLNGRRPPVVVTPPPVHDDRPTMAEFTTALAALERSQEATLNAITEESDRGRAHVEAIVTQLTGPATSAATESVTEPEPDTQLEGPMREASDEWITDDAMVDPFAPPAGLPLPPMPGVMPPDDL